MFKRIVLLMATAALLWYSASCSVVYSGCDSDDDCTAPEQCIKPDDDTAGECGIPDNGCLPGEMAACVSEEGECAGQVQVCDEATATFIPCANPEVCDGLDNDCNGVADNGIEGVGDACEVGMGVCLAQGQIICNADGSQSCNATPGQEEAPSCDCRDNNCDGTVDEFALSTPGLAVGATAPQTRWDLAVSAAGRRFATYEDGGTGDVVVFDLDNMVEVDRNAGTDPMLVEGEQGMIAFFYIAEGAVQPVADPPVLIPQLHYRLLDPVNATLTTETCISCVEGNSPADPVIEYDAIYGLCLDETPGSCAWQTVYIRQNGKASTGRVNEQSMMIEGNSVGPIIATDFQTIIDVKVAMSVPDEAYVAVALSAGAEAYSLGVIWARVTTTNNNRLQANPPENTVRTGLSGDPVFDISTVDFVDPETNQETVNFLLVWADTQNVNGLVQTRRFDPVNGPTVFSETPGTYSNLQIEEVCSQNAFIFWEVEPDTAPGTASVAGITINKGVPDAPVFRVDERSNEIPGAIPRAAVAGGQLHWGALVPLDGSMEVTPMTAVTPAVSEIICDN